MGKHSLIDPPEDSVIQSTLHKKQKMPVNKFHNVRAHRNPFSAWVDYYPIKPADMNWLPYYPMLQQDPSLKVEFVDIGCGFGGLLVNLAKAFPNNLTVGMEIRDKVALFVEDRIRKLREESGGKEYNNVSVVCTNAQKYLPNYFDKGQLSKLFILFPDPHFKECRKKRRIVNTSILAEYAYLLRPDGRFYIATDVKELFQYMQANIAKHPLFEEISAEELAKDPCGELILNSTDEAKKVQREHGSKWSTAFRRLAHPKENWEETAMDSSDDEEDTNVEKKAAE